MDNINEFMNIMGQHAKSSAFNGFTPLEYVLGEVTSIDPLMIKVDNRLELDSDHFILSGFVQETWINIPYFEAPKHTHPIPIQTTDSGCDAHPHTHTIPAWVTDPDFPKIMLWRGLWVGDVVRMFKVQQGQFYYVVEREEGITNEKGSA